MAPASHCRSQHNPYTASASAPKNYSIPTRSLLRTAAALFLSTSFTLRAFAQNPNPAQCPAYTTVDEKALYVQGGTAGSSQFYSLDLTVLNFNASSPPWKALSTGTGTNLSPNTNCPSMTLSANRQNLIVWNSVNIATYNMATGTWQPPLTLPATANSGEERVVTVADPGTGTVYALSGTSEGSRMLVWTESNGNTVARPMPDIDTTGNQTMTRYAAAWSSDRGSLFVLGGWKGGVVSKLLIEYNPKANTWTKAGNTPRADGLLDACMVPAYNGTKMVVFGGDANISPPSKLGNVYILDVKTMKWTTGATVNGAQARSGMACAAAGDNFVVWGGADKNQKPNSQPMIIYNMKTNEWTNQFSLPPPPPPPPSPTPSPSQGSSTGGTESTSPSSSSSSLPSKSNKDTTDTSNNVYLIAGFAAAVVVLAIIAILGYRRYRTKKPPKELTKEEFYADLENKHHADERGQPMDEDYLRERMAHHPQRSPRISPPIMDTYNARSRSRSPDEYDDDNDNERRVPSEEYYRRAPSPDQYNRRSSSPVYEMPPPVLMSRSTPTPPPSRRAAVAAAAAAAYSDDGRHGSKASYQGSDGGRRGGGGGGGRGGRGSNTGSGGGSAVGSAAGGGGGGGYVSDSDDPSTPRHDMTTRSYSPSRYRQPRYPHPNTPSPRPTHSQSSPSQQQQQQFEPHGLTTLSPVHHQGNRIRPQNNHGRDQQVHPDDLRAMDDATLYSHVKVVMQAVDERNRR